MAIEQTLAGWTGPSSSTEKDKQARTERMVRSAISAHEAFKNLSINVYAKGSYANNTNVKADSDVDISVQIKECVFWEEEEPGTHSGGAPYEGVWTPDKFRKELVASMKSKFGDSVDDSGSTAIQVNSSSARVDADIVPCFSYEYHFKSGVIREGVKIFKKDGPAIVNYPKQQISRGILKNNRTNYRYKKLVRIMKRLENLLVDRGDMDDLPSYFIECLAYNCRDADINGSTWLGSMQNMLAYIWNELKKPEPDENGDRWVEANDCFYLFHYEQRWSHQDAMNFADAAWDYLGLPK